MVMKPPQPEIGYYMLLPELQWFLYDYLILIGYHYGYDYRMGPPRSVNVGLNHEITPRNQFVISTMNLAPFAEGIDQPCLGPRTSELAEESGAAAALPLLRGATTPGVRGQRQEQGPALVILGFHGFEGKSWSQWFKC